MTNNDETPFFGYGAAAAFGDAGGSEEHRANESEDESEDEDGQDRANERPGFALTDEQQSNRAMVEARAADRGPSRDVRANRNLVAEWHPTLTHADVDGMDPSAVEKLADGIREQIDTPAGGLETYRANHSDESDEEECTCGHRAHEEEGLDEGEVAAGGYDTYRQHRDGADESDGDEVAAAGYDSWTGNGGE